VAYEQDGAALGGHGLEDEAEQLALQAFGLADGVDRGADADEQREVARDGRERRRLRPRRLGAQVERLLDLQTHGRVRRHLAFAHADGVRGERGGHALTREEDETRLADVYPVAVGEQVLAHGAAVDEGAVEAFEVGEDEPLALARDAAVTAREQRVGEPHVVRRVAPDRQLRLAQLEDRVLQRPRDDYDSRIHHSADPKP
jgi:hypothetical protein